MMVNLVCLFSLRVCVRAGEVEAWYEMQCEGRGFESNADVRSCVRLTACLYGYPVYMRARTHVYARVRTHTRLHTRTIARTHARTHAHTHTHTHTLTRVHTRTHAHLGLPGYLSLTHTHTLIWICRMVPTTRERCWGGQKANASKMYLKSSLATLSLLQRIRRR